jgi:hypothetical protein
VQTAHWDRKAVVFGAVTRGGMVRAEVVRIVEVTS